MCCVRVCAGVPLLRRRRRRRVVVVGRLLLNDPPPAHHTRTHTHARAHTSRYKKLDKPDWTPPNKVFGPAWALLYTSMGVANWLVLRAKDATASSRNLALGLYGAQLLLNFAYTPLLFSAKALDLALLDITGARVCLCVVSCACVCVCLGWRGDDELSTKAPPRRCSTRADPPPPPLFSPARTRYEQTALVGVAAAATVAMGKVSKPSAALMAPYLGWLTYATALNAEILRRKDKPVIRKALVELEGAPFRAFAERRAAWRSRRLRLRG